MVYIYVKVCMCVIDRPNRKREVLGLRYGARVAVTARRFATLRLRVHILESRKDEVMVECG